MKLLTFKVVFAVENGNEITTRDKCVEALTETLDHLELDITETGNGSAVSVIDSKLLEVEEIEYADPNPSTDGSMFDWWEKAKIEVERALNES